MRMANLNKTMHPYFTLVLYTCKVKKYTRCNHWVYVGLIQLLCYSVHFTGITYTAAKFDILTKNVRYPQNKLTAGVITETLIYFACIFMQK